MKAQAQLPATPAIAQYTQARNTACEQFLANNRVDQLWRGLTQATDELLLDAGIDPSLTLIAVGGYGRRELFPHSDIDVLVLVPEDASEDMREQAAQLLRHLWDRHTAVSHAVRTPCETIAAAQTDHTIAASLLSARYISGDAAAYRSLMRVLKAQVWGQETSIFTVIKLQERDVRHAKWGDSRFMLEPNVKEGKGALRDLQTLYWIADYCAAKRNDLLNTVEWKRCKAAYTFFSIVRAHMHLIRGRADERLTFDLQTELAGRLGFRGRTVQQKAERFMRRYFQMARETGTLTRIFCARLEQEQLRPSPALPHSTSEKPLPEGLILRGGRLDFAQAEALIEHPALAVALFVVASEHSYIIHPDAYLSIARAMPVIGRRLMFEGEASAQLLQLMLTSKTPEVHLRRMNEAGILGALIPEFERVAGMMQYDGYHTYTVDEHSLVAVGNLAAIEQGLWREQFPLTTAVARENFDRAALYVAMLCHDLAKGTGGAHAQKGEALVTRIAIRFGLSQAQANVAAWLVGHQELLTETAFKRDLGDSNTIADFVAVVQSPERLRLLLLLTVADVKAVGPTIWNGWKGALMRELYHRAQALMGVGEASIPQAGRLPEAAQHAYRQWQAAPQQPVFAITHDRFRAISEITCATSYTPHCFRQLAGVLSYLGASIVTARIARLQDDAAVMTIGIQDIAGNSFADEDDRLESLPELFAKAEAGKIDFARELPKRRKIGRGRDVAVTPAVFIDNSASAKATVIEVNARDRIGLFYDILGGLEDCQLQLVSAQLATYGAKAVDVFYVKDAYGHKVVHWTRLAQIERHLLAVCGEPAQNGTR